MIPNKILYDGCSYEVIYIADNTFANSNITSVRIGNNVTSIGDRCFYRCKNLESIELPASITHIGNQVFNGCSSLKTFIVPANLDKRSSLCFNGCTSLQKIIFPSENYRIEDIAVEGCKNLCEETKEHIIITEAGLRLEKERSLSTKIKRWSKEAALFPIKVMVIIVCFAILAILGIIALLILGVLYNTFQVIMAYIYCLILPLLIIGLFIYGLVSIFTDK